MISYAVPGFAKLAFVFVETLIVVWWLMSWPETVVSFRVSGLLAKVEIFQLFFLRYSHSRLSQEYVASCACTTEGKALSERMTADAMKS